MTNELPGSAPATPVRQPVPDPLRVVADSPLLRTVRRSSLDGLSPELEWLTLKEGQVLQFHGERGDALYFVASGRLEVVPASVEQDSPADEQAHTAILLPGDAISEMRTFTDIHGGVAVRCIATARLVKLAKDRLDGYLAARPDVAEELRRVLTPRFYRAEMIEVLQNMFGDLTEDSLADIERCLTWRRIARGDALLRPGKASNALFVVVSGRLQILASNHAQGERAVDQITAGESVGEAHMFTDETPATTVVAVRDSVLLEFSREHFHALAERYPNLNGWLARRLSVRLHGVIHNTRSEHPSTNILLVPVGDGAPVEDFGRSLAESLSRHATCLLVSSTRTDALLGLAGIAQAAEGSPEGLRLRAWLDQQEARFRYVVYVADSRLTHWTRRGIRQADEVISLGVATAAPNLTEVESEALRQEARGRVKLRKTLVLLHPSDSREPRDTIRWLRERHVQRHFHIRAENRNDLDRVARYVLQHEIGLVLSGGGARGFAHAGILRAIEEAGISVDVIAGVSMGAIIAGGYALSADVDTTVDLLKARIRGMLNDYTFPFVSLARGRRFDRCMRALFGETNIEDLRIPYFCLSSNLTRADTVVHRTGPLWRAVRASGGIPGLVPPVVAEGDLLYDGCLLNNLPADVMRDEIRTGVLIAVDVVPPVDMDIQATGLESPSGWRIALNRINPWTRRIEMPDIVSVLQRAGALGSIYNRQQLLEGDLADLYLRPPVEQFEILDFSVADEAVEIGYRYGVDAIGAWTSDG